MRKTSVVRALLLAGLLSLALAGVVGAQTPVPPETVTLPTFDNGAIVDAAFGVVGGFAVMIATMGAIKLAPRAVAALRRMLGAATG